MIKRWRRGERGAAAVEFALLLPFLLLIIGAIVDFGRFFYAQNITVNAAREGARLVVLGYPPVSATGADGAGRVAQAMIAYQGSGYTLKFTYKDSAAGTTSSCTFASTSPSCGAAVMCPDDAQPGQAMQVDINVTGFKYLVLGPASRLVGGNLTPPQPSATAEMRCAT